MSSTSRRTCVYWTTSGFERLLRGGAPHYAEWPADTAVMQHGVAQHALDLFPPKGWAAALLRYRALSSSAN